MPITATAGAANACTSNRPIGASYKSSDLNNYYWGVTDDEASVVVAPYEAEAGLQLAYAAHGRLSTVAPLGNLACGGV